MKKQLLQAAIAGVLGAGVGLPAASPGRLLRRRFAAPGRCRCDRLTLGGPALAWNRFVTPSSDDAAQQTLVFGGYRWKSDIAVEAAFNSRDQYALKSSSNRPSGQHRRRARSRRRSARVWNADVYTSWEFLRSFSLYGRLGYAQNDAHPLFSGASLVPGDARRIRDGVNYGVGLRYVLSQLAGLARRVFAVQPFCR